MDVNYWGLICVPLGILICFGPALLAAAIAGWRSKPDQDKRS
jgi:hypothetical protein